MINKLGMGDLTNVELERRDDEIGEMAESVKTLSNGLRNTAAFSTNIGHGNFNSDFQPLSEKDILGQSLITMRDNLKKVAEEDRQRNWTTEGMAKFGEILRSNIDNINDLSYNIISNLVRYINANQGILYLINDDNKNEVYAEMVACYAFNRKKYVDKKIEIGEGLVGQAIIEKDTIFITDIPDDYVHITSGLGGAAPKCILIVPLKINEKVYGAIEIASFVVLDTHEIQFVEKLAETIASSISSVKIAAKTRELLEQSQMHAEEMRAQEEEMRQNMEELLATQEEMTRANMEYKMLLAEKDKEIKKLKSVVEV